MKKIKLFIALISLLVLLSSCTISNFDTNALLSPPQMNAANEQIQKALASAVGEGFSLVYPKSGVYQNAVVTYDITGDGQKEALCFYTTDSDKNVSFTILKKDENKWKSYGMSQSQSATGIDCVNFFDYNDDGHKEIVIGWQYLLGDEKALEIFTISGEGQITSAFTGLYTALAVFEENIITLSRNATANTATASIIGLGSTGVSVTGTAALNNSVSAIVSVQTAKLGDGINAVFVDEQLESGLFVSELVTVSKLGDISNATALTGAITTRNSPITCTDVNGDSIPDIPVEKLFPSYENAGKVETLSYIDWYAVNENEPKLIMSAYTSVNEKFIIELDSSWQGHITVQKDAATDRQIHFYMQGDESNIPMFTVRVFSQQEFSEDLKSLGWSAIEKSNENVYAFRQYTSELPDTFKVDTARFANMFKLIS